MSRPEGCEARLACADGREVTKGLLSSAGSSPSLLVWRATSPPTQTPPASSIAQVNPAQSPSTPAKSVFLPDYVMFVFHRGCHDLENSHRDASFALILTATN